MNCCDWKDRDVPYWVSLEFEFFLIALKIFLSIRQELRHRHASFERKTRHDQKVGQFCSILSDLQALKCSIKPVSTFFVQNAQLERFRSAIKVLRNLCRGNDKVEELIEVDGKGWSIFNNPILTSEDKNLHNWISILFFAFLQFLWCRFVFRSIIKVKTKCRKYFRSKYFHC